MTRVLEGLIRNAHRRGAVLASAPPPPPPRTAALSFRKAVRGRGHLSVIAEFKRRSPSAGVIRNDDPARRARAYRRSGASAISVLTDPDAFGGSLADLSAAAASSSLPVLMKDFIVCPEQIRAGWSAGASAILLIARCLDDPSLVRLHSEAASLGLDVLVEVHDRAELDRALRLEDALIGINNRDLDTLGVDRRRALALLPRVPDGRVAVAESGYLEPDHLLELLGLADAVLIGTVLMKAPDPGPFLKVAAGLVPSV